MGLLCRLFKCTPGTRAAIRWRARTGRRAARSPSSTVPQVGLLEHFAELEDPRTRCSPHGLLELLLTAIGAVLSGADTWVAVSVWGRAKLDWLRQFLPFENGIASHDTFGRVFALLDSAVFERCFLAWMRSLCGAFEGLQMALDGKTIRRSQTAGQKAIHVVSAVGADRKLTQCAD